MPSPEPHNPSTPQGAPAGATSIPRAEVTVTPESRNDPPKASTVVHGTERIKEVRRHDVDKPMKAANIRQILPLQRALFRESERDNAAHDANQGCTKEKTAAISQELLTE